MLFADLPKIEKPQRANEVNLRIMRLKINIHLFLLAVGLTFSNALAAQITQQRMGVEPKAGAGIFRPYFYEAGTDAVKSIDSKYKPFYLSHFGRHGSRYYSQPKSWQQTMDCFEAAAAAGQLTPAGDSLYAAIKSIYDAHDDMHGELAPLGAVEHRQIARRMYDREKPVFSSRTRNKVRCVSSVYSRCLMSMANFTEELSGLAPSLDVSYMAGKRYNNDYINAPLGYDFSVEADKIIDSLKQATLHPEALLSLYFTDAAMDAVVISDPYAVEMGLYYFWAISYCLDFLGLDITSMIPSEELAACAAVDNATKYAKVAVSEEFGKYTRIKGIKLLKDFLVKADDALKAGSDVAADLRFAHDSAFLPMCALLGIEGYPVYTIEEAHAGWNAADVVPMCSNLQMVFYKVKGDVLVKILVNEKEAVLSSLKPVHGIFYRWVEIKSLIEGLENSDYVNYNSENKSQNNQLYE